MNLAYLEVDYHRSAFDAMPVPMRAAFMERVVLSWLYHEHALEGIVLTESDIWRALNNQPCRNYCDGLVQKSLRKIHAAAYHIMDQATAPDAPEVSLDWLKDIHAMISHTPDTAGRYRKRDTSPGVYNLDVVGASSISYYLRKFLDLYHEELTDAHPVRAAALAHWEFMKVFPFDERTGLVGRLMLNYILLKNNYPPAIIHASDRHLYFQALAGHREDLIPVVVDAVSSTISAASAFSAQHIASHGRRAAL